MKELARKVFRIGSTVMENKDHSFELFGLDYLIDQQNKVWLIEVNNNPSLEICSSLLARLVPNMIENVMNIVVDPYFPPPERKSYKENGIFNPDAFHFELIYDRRGDKEIEQYVEDINFEFKDVRT